MDQDKKRDRERVSVGSLHGEVQLFQPMTVLDMSHSGARIETHFPLHIDSLHDFRLSLGERSLIVKGRIVRSEIAELNGGTILYRTGVEFVEPTEHVAAAIGEFVDALREMQSVRPIVDGEITE
ncbi:MAG TPA: PilZ domain-containing protein [Vicinamibacterales bacterium]|nr:PilZ domain-containing protein [Vicinamibacterales bacterium]